MCFFHRQTFFFNQSIHVKPSSDHLVEWQSLWTLGSPLLGCASHFGSVEFAVYNPYITHMSAHIYIVIYKYMCLYVYLYIFVCVYISLYIYIYVCIYIYICIYRWWYNQLTKWSPQPQGTKNDIFKIFRIGWLAQFPCWIDFEINAHETSYSYW